MQETIPRKKHPVRRALSVVFGLLAFAVVLLILFWNWDWFIPIVEARASAALGRKVTLTHLHVKLGRQTTVTATGVTVDNPSGFPAGDAPLAKINQLAVTANVMDYIHGQHIVLPSIVVDQPDVHATVLVDGKNNFSLPAQKPSAHPAPPPQIGQLEIDDGKARFVDPKLKADFAMTVATRAASGSEPAAIVVSAKGSYAAQPVLGHFVGGALLSLRDTRHPYPVDLHIENGDTKVSLHGTVQNPLNFAGANLTLDLTGPDMSALYPLTGIPIPQTPPYSIAGKLDYRNARIRFTDFQGKVGSSDLEGAITVDPHATPRPDVTMDLASRRVDLTDLGGFIGTPPGRKATPGETATQKQQLAHAEAKGTVLPDTPLNIPKIRAADIHLKYRGEHIENKFTPFDRLVVDMDVEDGKIRLHPLDFVVGDGSISSTIALVPDSHDLLHTDASIKFQHINLSRLMQATHSFHGEGIIGGEAELVSDGNSLAGIMAHGNGEVKLVLVSGGNISALLVDISGLEFGNALLSALGVPNRAKIDCFVTDLPLKDGVMSAKAFLLNTSEAQVTGKGWIDFRNQSLDFALTTRSRHFSIGSLPGPIDITGKLGDPSIRPGAEVVARAGAAAGLGVLLTPLGALLPTIQFGVGNNNACTKAYAEESQPMKVAAPPRRRTTHHRKS